MQKTIKLFLLVFAWVISTNANSQDHLQVAQLVLNNNDTINGFIDVKAWEVNKDEVKFSLSNTDIKIIKYAPDVVKSLRFDNYYYTGQLVELEISSRNTISLTKNAEYDLKRRVLFLQVLIDGSKQLLYYQDELRKPHFFFSTEGEIKPFLYKMYLKRMEATATANERYGRAENTRYRGQLAYYFSDVPQAAAEAQSVEYTVASMTNAYRQYYKLKRGGNSNNSTDLKPSYYSTGKSASNFGIVFGLNKYGNPSGSGITLGITHTKLSSKNGNMYWHNELLLLSKEYEYEVRSVNSFYQVVSDVAKQRASFIRIGTNLRFALTEGEGAKPFLGGGAAIEIVRSMPDEIEDAAGTSLKLTASAGLQGKKASAEIKYDVGGNQLFLLVGIKFGKK